MLESTGNADLLAAWRNGNQAAATILVRRYMTRLVALARSRMSQQLARRLDAEDVVMSAWRSFFVRAEDLRLVTPDNDDMWPLLVTMTVRKIARQAERHQAQRRSMAREVQWEADSSWEETVAVDPTPEQAVILADELQSLLAAVSPVARQVVERRLAGEELKSIAKALDCSERTVRRALSEVREHVATQGNQLRRPVAQGFDQGLHRKSNIPLKTAVTTLATFHDKDVVLEKLIGQGGFGKVYRAVRVSDQKYVAVKYLKKRFWTDDHARNALLREHQIVSEFGHPHIVKQFGWGQSRNGAVFLVSEFVDGQESLIWVRTHSPSPAVIVNKILPVLDALHVVHQRGLIHGDLTPSNVLIDSQGAARLTDFGFAASLNEHLTGMTGGTPGFLAPEQLSSAFGPVTLRTDVYGIGGLLYALLTGEPPMAGPSVSETLANVLSSRPPRPLPLSDDRGMQLFSDLLMRCLQKEPASRPADISQIREGLQSVADAFAASSNKPASQKSSRQDIR